MKNYKSYRTAMIAAAALTMAGCASTPRENPEIVRLQSELQSAYGDKYIAGYGRAELEKADTTLRMAREVWRGRETPELFHHIEMTEAYLDLARVRGKQEWTRAEITDLRSRQDQLRLAARDRDVRAAQTQTAAYRDEAAQANSQAAQANYEAAQANTAAQTAQMATQETQEQLLMMRQQLNEFEFRITELGETLVLRDVMFEVGSSSLRPGAANRLEPLVKYLAASPETRVSIEGHTDSTGAVEYNNKLSEERADAIAAALNSSGIASDRITTTGFGPSKPIASNDTVSGREQNRRVEITLLK